ncbi:MAG: ATP-binding protein [Sporichthyaceae bacterium]
MALSYRLGGRADAGALDDLRVLWQRVTAEHPQLDALDLALFETALTELMNNLIVHGDTDGDCPPTFDLELEVGRGGLSGRLVDDGAPGPDPEQTHMPMASELTGRGIPLARAVLDRLTYERRGDTNVWTLQRLPR